MDSKPQPDKTLAAVCGLFCPACTIYIGSMEDPERLAKSAARSGRTVVDTECHGCRAEKRMAYCATCKMAACAAERGLDFCGACSEYPCAELTAFQAARPHRLELWEAQARIREVGYEQWIAEMLEHYACPACGTLNSAYDLTCRRCGHDPGSAYVARHKAEILQYLAGR
ncbi:MAG TPA: DUF3795 domain-containing protein [Anaerolineae bacterium]|nr:DUF3795 domain-containing protein [Anaerolineae bacterium]